MKIDDLIKNQLNPESNNKLKDLFFNNSLEEISKVIDANVSKNEYYSENYQCFEIKKDAFELKAIFDEDGNDYFGITIESLPHSTVFLNENDIDKVIHSIVEGADVIEKMGLRFLVGIYSSNTVKGLTPDHVFEYGSDEINEFHFIPELCISLAEDLRCTSTSDIIEALTELKVGIIELQKHRRYTIEELKAMSELQILRLIEMKNQSVFEAIKYSINHIPLGSLILKEDIYVNYPGSVSTVLFVGDSEVSEVIKSHPILSKIAKFIISDFNPLWIPGDYSDACMGLSIKGSEDLMFDVQNSKKDIVIKEELSVERFGEINWEYKDGGDEVTAESILEQGIELPVSNLDVFEISPYLFLALQERGLTNKVTETISN